MKYNDDSEPTGTAGLPILEVLKKKNLNYVVCFVIRYFGGIKLGSGGLIRAYSNSCSLCLKKTEIVKLEQLFKIKLVVSYKEEKWIEKIIPKKNILEKVYKDNITYLLLVNETLKEKLDSNHLNYLILENTCF